MPKAKADRDLVRGKNVYEILAKNVTTLHKEHELLRDADSDMEDDRQRMLELAKEKLISSVKKVVSVPQPQVPHTAPAAPERLALRELYRAVELERQSPGDGEDIKQRLRDLQAVFTKTSGPDPTGAVNDQGDINPMEGDDGHLELDEDPWQVTIREHSVNIDMPDIPDDAFIANRAQKLNQHAQEK